MRLLILGGTTEATALSCRLERRVDIDATLSLAGRTQNPSLPVIPCRIGGFGGAEGLKAYLVEQKIDAVIDATHPFAAQMSSNAAAACAGAGVTLAVLSRPPWQRRDGDRWIEVADMHAAADALGPVPRRVFLTVGGLQLGAFAQAPHHYYLVRTIDEPAAIAALPNHTLILARGPFDVAAEIVLMRSERIDLLVTKNSGGTATEAKLSAARSLNIPVVMVQRPAAGNAVQLGSIDEALAWIDHQRTP